jgi:acetate kinase
VAERVNVLVVNAGSSSLKLSRLDGDRLIAAHTIDEPTDIAGAITTFIGADTDSVDAVGHRVVHGGTTFVDATPVDDGVLTALHDLVDLAPLHQPAALRAIDAARAALPDAKHVACFDTAFHATLPAAAATYALPAEWRARWPLRRFGFHGLSHAYASRRAAALAGVDLADARIVSCHLGAGASLCAIDRGRSIDTTMGFTPLEGLVMATRAGSVDPGLVTWLAQRGGMEVAAIERALEHGSGLQGLCGSADMREVVSRRGRGDESASLAFDVYTHALRRALGAMTGVLGAVDIVVFTGGVGEHTPSVRAACGLALDGAANDAASSDAEIGAAGAPMRTFVVQAREDLEIARQVAALLTA